MYTKRIGHYAVAIVLLVVLSSCDAGFDDLNTDETSLTSVDPVLQLNSAIVNSAPDADRVRCESSIVKQQMRIFTGVGACGNFNVDGRQTSSSNWNNGYQQIRDLEDALTVTADEPGRSNLNNMIRILRAYTFMIITDSYGDVPYSEAGKALEGTVNPSYDPQESIYTGDNGILEELAGASAALDPSQSAPDDVLYEGDVTRWQRLGYSLLLRAAMRLSKVEPGLAEEYVGIAVSGGLMQSNDDNAIIYHTGDYTNPVGSTMNGGNSHFQYLVEDFVDYLKENDDPRLASIAVRYPGAEGSGDQNEENADRSPENQIGIPMGYDNSDIGPVAEEAGLSSFFAYSQLDRTRMGSQQAPSFLVTYAQTQLLLAEAAFRDWTQGDPATLYANGIEAHMQQLEEYGADTAVPQNEIDAFVQANPLEQGQELEQINTQYWVASYLIGDEAWANFRRSGFPDLAPNPRQDDLGPEEDFMRRFGYPDSEYSVNESNVEEANGRQGPDQIDTRIWWDVR